MALRLIRRHVKDCAHTSTRYRRCKCPIHVYGTLAGEKIRKALDQTSWDAATELINSWTVAGEIGVVKIDAPTTREAVGKFFEDCEARKLGGTRRASTGICSRIASFHGPSGRDSTTSGRSLSILCVSFGSHGATARSTHPRIWSGCGRSSASATRLEGQAESSPLREATKGDAKSDVAVSRDEMKASWRPAASTTVTRIASSVRADYALHRPENR